VEEEKLVRRNTQEFIEKKRKENAAQQLEEATKHFEETIRPVMNNIQDIVAQASGGKTKLDEKSLEALAKWKLGL
jgi:tRNA uridine 5-carbamoylmethylation protein Kti12